MAHYTLCLENLRQFTKKISSRAVLIWKYLLKLVCNNVTLACFKKKSLEYLHVAISTLILLPIVTHFYLKYLKVG